MVTGVVDAEIQKYLPLLGNEEKGIDIVPEEHKEILNDRINAYESGNAKAIKWEEAKNYCLVNNLLIFSK